MREGPIEDLLQGEGVVRVRVAESEVADGVAHPRPDRRRRDDPDRRATTAGWIAIRLDPSRAAEVNRALASAGIFASGLETGSDLESLFLELTAAEQPTSHEGTITGPVGWGQAGAGGPGRSVGPGDGPGDGAGAA